jgi:hypothetical protein
MFFLNFRKLSVINVDTNSSSIVVIVATALVLGNLYPFLFMIAFETFVTVLYVCELLFLLLLLLFFF